MSGRTCSLRPTWPSSANRNRINLLVGALFTSCLHALILAFFGSRSPLTWLETIVDNESWLIHIQMSRVGRVIQVVVTLWLGWLSWQRFHSSWAIIYCLRWVLQRLLYLLLLFLADEALHLLLWLLAVGWHRVRCTQCRHASLIALLLHLLIFIEQLFLEVIVLLLSLWPLAAWEDIAANTLELTLHLETRLLLLKLLKLLLDYHIMLLLLLEAVWWVTWLIKRVSVYSAAVVFVWRWALSIVLLIKSPILLVIHWVVLASNVLNSVFVGVWLHNLLNTSREWPLWSSLDLMVNEGMLAVLVLLQTTRSSLLEWVHGLQVHLILSIRVGVSVPIHLSLWPLDVLLLADLVTHCSWLLGWLLSRGSCLLWWVAYRVLVLNIVVRGSNYFILLFLVPAIVGQNVLVHQEINSPRELIHWQNFMSASLIMKVFSI